MRKFLQLGFVGLLVVAQLHAAEIANLRNGFSIRHERHEVVGDVTRLYMSAEPSGGYVDVPTAEVEAFEPAPPEPQVVPTQAATAVDLKTIVERSQHAQPGRRRLHCQRYSCREREQSARGFA